MRVSFKIAIFLIALAIFSISVPGSLVAASRGKDFQYNIGASVGYRIDTLDWSIAGDRFGSNPNVLSELEFDDMEILQGGVDANLVFHGIYLRASLYAGYIRDGDGKDSDYLEDDRNGLYSRSESQLDDNVRDMSLGLGYQFEFAKKALKIAPLVGASYHEQNIRLSDGIQTVATSGSTPAIGPLSGLNSTYKTQWKSWWIGVDISMEIRKGLFLSSSLEYHDSDYEAEANWNLRDDLFHPLSFSHEADGEGAVLKAGINRRFAQAWTIGLAYCWQHWWARRGVDRLFLSTGETATSRLNEVKWDSHALMLSLVYGF